MRPAVAHRHTEALRVTQHDVGAHFSGRREQCEAEQVARHRHEHARGVGARDEAAQVVHDTGFVRRLHEGTEDAIAKLHRLHVANDEFDAERFGPRHQHVDGLRIAAVRDEELRRSDDVVEAFRLRAVQQRHRFARGRGLVKQRRRRDLHPRQLRHHRLVVEQRLEAPLGDFRLVGGIGRVPTRVLQHVAEDDAWGIRVVVAEADVGAEQAVLRGDTAQVAEEGVLGGARRQVERRVQADAGRNGFVDQAVQRGRPDHRQHGGGIGSVGTDVTRLEDVVIEDAHFTRSEYWVTSRRVPVSLRSDSLMTTIQLACGSEFTASGFSFNAAFTSTTSPETGA